MFVMHFSSSQLFGLFIFFTETGFNQWQWSCLSSLFLILLVAKYIWMLGQWLEILNLINFTVLVKMFWTCATFCNNWASWQISLVSCIKYVPKIFQRTNISNPLRRTRTYQGGRNVSFSEKFAYVLSDSFIHKHYVN